LGGWFRPIDESLLILNKIFNKNYRLLLKRLYGRAKLKNHSFRKLSSERGMRTSPTSLQSKMTLRIDDYW